MNTTPSHRQQRKQHFLFFFAFLFGVFCKIRHSVFGYCRKYACALLNYCKFAPSVSAHTHRGDRHSWQKLFSMLHEYLYHESRETKTRKRSPHTIELPAKLSTRCHKLHFAKQKSLVCAGL